MLYEPLTGNAALILAQLGILEQDRDGQVAGLGARTYDAESGRLSLSLDDGRTVELEHATHLHSEDGYAVRIRSRAGHTVRRGFLHIDRDLGVTNLQNNRMVYIADPSETHDGYAAVSHAELESTGSGLESPDGVLESADAADESVAVVFESADRAPESIAVGFESTDASSERVAVAGTPEITDVVSESTYVAFESSDATPQSTAEACEGTDEASESTDAASGSTAGMPDSTGVAIENAGAADENVPVAFESADPVSESTEFPLESADAASKGDAVAGLVESTEIAPEIVSDSAHAASESTAGMTESTDVAFENAGAADEITDAAFESTEAQPEQRAQAKLDAPEPMSGAEDEHSAGIEVALESGDSPPDSDHAQIDAAAEQPASETDVNLTDSVLQPEPVLQYVDVEFVDVEYLDMGPAEPGTAPETVFAETVFQDTLSVRAEQDVIAQYELQDAEELAAPALSSVQSEPEEPASAEEPEYDDAVLAASQLDRFYAPLHQAFSPEEAEQFEWVAETDTIQTYEHRQTFRYIHIDARSGLFYNQARIPISRDAALKHALTVPPPPMPEPETEDDAELASSAPHLTAAEPPDLRGMVHGTAAQPQTHEIAHERSAGEATPAPSPAPAPSSPGLATERLVGRQTEQQRLSQLRHDWAQEHGTEPQPQENGQEPGFDAFTRKHSHRAEPESWKQRIAELSRTLRLNRNPNS